MIITRISSRGKMDFMKVECEEGKFRVVFNTETNQVTNILPYQNYRRKNFKSALEFLTATTISGELFCRIANKVEEYYGLVPHI